MTKICLMPKTIDEISIDIDAVIIGYKNFNTLNVLELDMEEIIKLRKNYNKKLYVSLNQLIHDNKVEEIKNILSELSKLNIDGILFDDLGIIEIAKENNLNINLIWANTHQVTNYKTINSYEIFGTTGAFISPDITLPEITEIKKNIQSKMFVPIFGKFEIFSSNRFLLSNYLKYINKKKTDSTYYIENNNTKYPIYEDNNGTHIINGNILNGLKEYIILLENSIDYAVINSYDIDNIKLVIENFNKVKKMYDENKIDEKLVNKLEEELTNDINKGFLYTETIYKVKSDVNER